MASSLSTLFAIAASLAGYLLPGYFVARVLRAKAPWAAGFLISLILIFYAVLFIGDAGTFVTATKVSWVLAGVTAGCWVLDRFINKKVNPGATAPSVWNQSGLELAGQPERFILGSTALLLVLLACKTVIYPVSGFDTLWRWDILPQIIAQHGSLDFYPTVTGGDYKYYPWPDSFPPLIPTTYWFIYAFKGAHDDRLTAVPVMLQFLAVSVLAFRLGRVLGGTARSGMWALACMLLTPAIVHAIAIGQETGLTAIGMLACAYFVATADSVSDWRAAVLAALCISTSALCREYGAAFVVCGLAMLVFRRMRLRCIVLYLLTATVVGGAWYLRTYLKCGNPLGSFKIAGGLFPYNARFAAMFALFSAENSPSHFSFSQWAMFLKGVLDAVIVPGAAGLLVMACRPRKWMWLIVPSAIVFALYVASIGRTNSFHFYGVRVLSPLLVVAAVALGCWLADKFSPIANSKSIHHTIVALMVIATAWSAINIGQIPFSAPTSPASLWLEHSFTRRTPYSGPIDVTNDVSAFPPGSRLVTNNTFLWVRMLDTNLKTVPCLSPEVDFMFDQRYSSEEVVRMARERNIAGAIILPLEELDVEVWRDSPLINAKGLLVPGKAPYRSLIILNFLPNGNSNATP